MARAAQAKKLLGRDGERLQKILITLDTPHSIDGPLACDQKVAASKAALARMNRETCGSGLAREDCGTVNIDVA